MENYDDEDTCYTWAHFKFKSIRIVENTLTSSFSKMKAEIITSDEATDADIKTVLDKIHFWFDSIVGNGIMFERDNEFALNLLFTELGIARTDNIPIVMPAIPSDDVLARILHAKLNALGNEKVFFGMLEITSDNDFTITFTGDGESELPDMSEWIGERSYFEKPWWARNDGTTLDVIPEDTADLSVKPVLGVDISFIDTRYKPQDDVAIILRPKFSPEVISGGKND